MKAGIGGHIATYQSAATCTRWASITSSGPDDEHGGDLVYFQGHSSPGVYARAFLEGRITEEQLANFRREVDGKGLSSYPHPWLMPDFWQFPTVSMGLTPIRRSTRRASSSTCTTAGSRNGRAQGLGFPGRRRDGRARVAGRDLAGDPREAGQPDLRHQLQPAASGRTGARQRQDHPGAGGGLPRRRLERHQGDLGRQLGPAAGPRSTGLLRKRMEEAVDGEYQAYREHDGAYIREHFFGTYPELRRWCQTCPTRRSGACGAAATTRRRSTRPSRRRSSTRVSRRSSWPRRSRATAWARRARAEHHPPAEEDGRGGAAAVPRPIQHPDLRRRIDELPFYKPAEDSAGDALPARAPRGVGRLFPPSVDAAPLAGPGTVGFECLTRESGIARSRPPWSSCVCSWL